MRRVLKCAYAYDKRFIVLRWPCVVDRTLKSNYQLVISVEWKPTLKTPKYWEIKKIQKNDKGDGINTKSSLFSCCFQAVWRLLCLPVSGCVKIPVLSCFRLCENPCVCLFQAVWRLLCLSISGCVKSIVCACFRLCEERCVSLFQALWWCTMQERVWRPSTIQCWSEVYTVQWVSCQWHLTYLSSWLPAWLSVFLSVCLPVFLSAWPVFLSVCLSIFFVCLPACICQPAWLCADGRGSDVASCSE